jgi:peptidoglycan/LPS O-acetylase OafA/YrhL
MKERRYDIDWLRVIAMLAIFFYHCARFFGTEGWHLKNAEQNEF